MASYISSGLRRKGVRILPRSRRFSSSSALNAKIGFIGLGNMGLPMATNLVKGGHEVRVFDLNKDAVSKAVSAGAMAGDTASAVADGADAVVTMLPAEQHVRAAVCGDTGVLKTIPRGSIIIDSSTIAPTGSRSIEEQVRKAGVMMVDAPVSGGVRGAEAGTLTFMVGGEEEALEAARPYLQCMGKNIVHCGAIGTGEVAKLCNNMALGIEMIAISEAMNLGQRLGIDMNVLAKNNPHPGVVPNAPASNGYKGGFGTELMIKDIALAVDSAKAAGANIPFGSSALQLYAMARDHGAAGHDFSAIYRFIGKAN